VTIKVGNANALETVPPHPHCRAPLVCEATISPHELIARLNMACVSLFVKTAVSRDADARPYAIEKVELFVPDSSGLSANFGPASHRDTNCLVELFRRNTTGCLYRDAVGNSAEISSQRVDISIGRQFALSHAAIQAMADHRDARCTDIT